MKPPYFRTLVPVAMLLLAVGCHSPTVQEQAVVAAPVVSSQASFDGNTQNSGIVSVDERGFVVTNNFLVRYDALLKSYGMALHPSRTPGDREGVTPEGSGWRFDGEALGRFIVMNKMRKADNAP